MRARATRLLTEGDGALVISSEGPLVPFATPLLLKYASEAVHELLTQHRDNVARNCGGQITKDLALGSLLGDALGVELLSPKRRAELARKQQPRHVAEGSQGPGQGDRRQRGS